jgi:predicted DNA-binding transcriptional regulator YafY
MDTLYRRWLILKMIPRHGNSITTVQIADRLDGEIESRTVRSIQRDLVELERHFPITFVQEGRTFHWSWNKGWQLTLPVMDPHTALTFHLVREYIATLLPTTSIRFLEPFFQNAEDILAENKDLTVAHWLDKVCIVTREIKVTQPSIMKGVTETVYDAVLMGKQIRARYRKKDDEAAQEYSELHPLGLVFVEGLIYLIATEGDNVNLLRFLLHRIEEVILLEKSASIPEGFTLQGYIESGEFSYPVTKIENIRLKALFQRKASAHLHEIPITGKVHLKEFDDDRVLLEAEVLVNRELRCWLRGFGAEVEVLAPEGLRDEFKSTVERLKIMYR